MHVNVPVSAGVTESLWPGGNQDFIVASLIVLLSAKGTKPADPNSAIVPDPRGSTSRPHALGVRRASHCLAIGIYTPPSSDSRARPSVDECRARGQAHFQPKPPGVRALTPESGVGETR